MNRKLKKSVVYFLYGLAFVFMLGGIFYIDSNNINNYSSGDNQKYVSKDIVEKIKDLPVNSIENKKDIINKPFSDDSVKILRNYYSLFDDEETQQNSILFYENTYMPSSGISYGNDSSFEVLAILDGKVIDIKEDELLGNVIVIEHDNGIISSYQSITDIKVKKDDIVKQGDVISKSSTSNISIDLGNHLYFELMINGTNVDPEEYYGKCIDEI